jgi:hypothetical protein
MIENTARRSPPPFQYVRWLGKVCAKGDLGDFHHRGRFLIDGFNSLPQTLELVPTHRSLIIWSGSGSELRARCTRHAGGPRDSHISFIGTPAFFWLGCFPHDFYGFLGFFPPGDVSCISETSCSARTRWTASPAF